MKQLIMFMLMTMGSLAAEVELVTIKWTPANCIENCVQALHNQFAKVSGVAEIAISQSAGEANLKWKPNVPFTFPPINTAMSLVGLSINDLRIKVRGKISHHNQIFNLVSAIDGGKYQLLGPIQPSATTYVIEYNILSHPLSDELKQQLLQAEQQQLLVTITGPLFEPERSPPLYLIVEKLN